ncbi:3-methyladenine DNA glycosylase AlkD [Amaricoccus macauensis]|uniref:3-methyladenine DNA glycosylase AlkD n=1 Tax=Amaricoccus macauensis TaxID=57001 RepID=A0A840SF46_9RHOB|nr:DNA alkylation repair protein [Amaricoccus macauensis]MBB5220457.1 3-methyladenine DNA glycosylase AlkD [Amaricoccus macauensis]
MDPATALSALHALSDPVKAAGMADYHKAPRRYLGIALSDMEPLVADWRSSASVAERVALAAGLWDSDIHEARIAAAKLLTQARIREDEAMVWSELQRWVSEFDAWAIADHTCKAIERRLVAEPARLDVVETWTGDPVMWVRRAALVATLPWAKLTHPSAEDLLARERMLGWAASMVADRNWFIQKAIGWWLRTLSVHDAGRVHAFVDGPGVSLKPFARREALRRLRDGTPTVQRTS